MNANLRMQFALTPAISPGERGERSRPDLLCNARLDLKTRRLPSQGLACSSKGSAIADVCPSHDAAADVHPLLGERAGVRADPKRIIAAHIHGGISESHFP